MPTVIDSLVVELGIDPKKFIGGQKAFEAALKSLIEQAGKGATEVEHRSNRTIEYLDKLKRGVLTTVGLFLGGKGFKDFLSNIASVDAATGRFADTIGLSIKQLGTWENAIKAMGGSAESVRSAMGTLNADIRAFEAGVPGGGQFLQIMQALGVDVRGKNIDAVLLEAGEAVKRRHPGDKNRQAFELQQIPGMNSDLVNFLLLSMQEKMERLRAGERAAPNERDRQTAEEYQRTTAQLATAVERFSAAITNLIASPLSTVLEALTRLVNAIGGRDTESGFKRRHQPGMQRTPEVDPNIGTRGVPPAITGMSTPIPAPTAPTGGAMSNMAMAIQRAEGWYPGSRSFVNNNPGNIKFGPFSKSMGATGVDDKGHAIFPDYATGRAALEALLSRKARGQSIEQINSWWAPDQPEWGKNVSWGLGVGLGHVPFPAGGAGSPNIAVGATARAGVARGGGSTSTATTNINQINVQTRATDADGIARDIGTAIERNRTVAPVNFGQE